MIIRALVLALVAIVITLSPAAAQKEGGNESSTCISTQTSGSGEALFATCVTNTGNVTKFVTPSGVSNLHGDSYAICDQETGAGMSLARAYSREGNIELNFAAPSSHTTTSNVRKTADGRYTLTQSFARDAPEKQLVITMTLKNNGPGPVTNVRIARFVDIDAGGNAIGDVFSKSLDSVTGVEATPGQEHGMMVGVLTPEISHVTQIVSYSDFSTAEYKYCAPTAPYASPTTDGDWVAFVRFDLGTMAAGASRTVKLFYRRF
jgi:hypothetical protein